MLILICQALSTKFRAAVGKVVQISEVAGTGLSSSLGGYFKLQVSGNSRSDIVVVAFGSAPGVPNWGGLLGRTRAAMLANNKTPVFDVLYVVDSRRSWYTETKSGDEQHCYVQSPPLCFSTGAQDTGFEMKEYAEVGAYYRRELREALKRYKRIIMIGDSMGASAGLLFSHLATSVVAFCPQVDMTAAAIRPGRDKNWLNRYKQGLLTAVMASSAHITVHCGTWEHDKYQARLLPKKVNVVVHNSEGHRLSKELNEQGSLVTIVRTAIEKEIDILLGDSCVSSKNL